MGPRHGRAAEAAPTADVLAALGVDFPAYRAPGAVTGVITMTIDALTGWAAAPTLS